MKLYIILALSVFTVSSFLMCSNSTAAKEKVKTNSKTEPQEIERVIDSLKIVTRKCSSDKDGDGINDLEDFLIGARKDVENKPSYDPAYCKGGYPVDSKGVCTDLIWRAFKSAGYNLKNMIDEDIRKFPSDYKNSVTKPDPNIDFRRVKNQAVYFKKYGVVLTQKLTPGDSTNLSEWQPGDIVTFRFPEHIAMISDLRRPDGVPYLLHNCGPFAAEEDVFLLWAPEISAHYRFPGR